MSRRRDLVRFEVLLYQDDPLLAWLTERALQRGLLTERLRKPDLATLAEMLLRELMAGQPIVIAPAPPTAPDAPAAEDSGGAAATLANQWMNAFSSDD